MGAKHKSVASRVWQMVQDYFAEFVVSFAVLTTAYAGSLYAPTVPDYRSLLLAICMVFMLIGLIIMFNVAQMRVAAVDLWDMLHKEDEDDGGGLNG